MNRRDENTLLLDVRNHRECVIGGFDGSLDPLTKTFADFPVWVRKNKDMLENKKVWMLISTGRHGGYDLEENDGLFTAQAQRRRLGG